MDPKYYRDTERAILISYGGGVLVFLIVGTFFMFA